MIEVVHFERFPRPHLFSIERVSAALRASLPADIKVSTWRCRRNPSSMRRRLADAWAARARRELATLAQAAAAKPPPGRRARKPARAAR